MLGTTIINASAIFWDEVPMLHKHAFEAVDRLFRHILDNDSEPFGGKTVVLGGDFRQTLPIVVHGSQSDIEGASLKQSSILWIHITILPLTRNLRIGKDIQHQPFIDYLLRIGNGTEDTYSDGINHDYVRIPNNVILTTTGENMDNNYEKQLIRATFPEINTPNISPNMFIERAILCPLNADVNKIVELATNMFHSDETATYHSIDYIASTNPNAAAHFPTEFLNTLEISSLPLHTLTLKVG
jgi:ATP-dependent DNA helicase PIF1